jgi:BolA family transcriptional regulator, general stress-responsive regulator
VTDTLRNEIEARLRAALPIAQVDVWDESEAHKGHAGARGGGGHFHLRLVSAAFDGKGRLARHRLVYDALSQWIPARIHALSIDARSPSESE